MSIASILKSIGHFFENLFKSSEAQFDKLSDEDKAAVINGSIIPQVLKQNLDASEDFIVSKIATLTSLPESLITILLQHVFDEVKVKSLAEYQTLLKSAENSSLWKGILDTTARVAAIAISKGSLTWEGLGLGLLQVAFEKYVKNS